MVRRISARLGAQLWLERDTDPRRIDALVDAAAGCGLGLLRVFLVWPWIEPEPDCWDFRVYDEAFDAADRRGVRIKATLGPDTAPWHAGTPGYVQSGHLSLPVTGDRRAGIERYLRACVTRYRDSPALAQWILWNEPVNPAGRPGRPDPRRTDELRSRWAELLRGRFLDDLEALNRRWHTGYKSFEDIPFPEDIGHPAHRDGPFFSFDPWLADYRLRADGLRDELRWVHDTVRALDPQTPTCFNPPDLFRNHAELGYDLAALAGSADVLGASVHAPWHLGFAPRTAHVGLTAAAVRMLAAVPGGHRVELTEVQVGNVYHGSPHPQPAGPADVSAAYLAPVLAGATSATGWSLNARQADFEAGDWALLDDDDAIGERGRAAARVARVLAALDDRIGAWRPAAPEALVLFGEASQAVTLVHSWTGSALPGRDADDAVQGVGLLTNELLGLGIAASPAPVSALAALDHRPALLVASALGAYDEATAGALLARAEAGSTLLIDGLTGRKDPASTAYRPWPGHLARPLGLRAASMVTRADGHPIRLYGGPAGRLPLVRTDYRLSAEWSADERLTLADEADQPLVWRRPYGRGAVLLFAGPLGPALRHDPRTRPAVRRLLAGATALVPAARPLSPDTIALPVRGARGDAVGVFGPASRARGGGPLRLALPAGDHHDLWADRPVPADDAGQVLLDAPDGIALLVTRTPAG